MSRVQIGTRLFAKKLKRMCLIGTWRELSQCPKRCQPEESWANAQKGAIWHFERADRHSKSAEWYFWTRNALSWSITFWTPFLGFLDSGLALRCVLNSYSKIFTSFLDNLGLFSNNYLVDKYSKINLDKVQIIHNFIVIQLSPFFLCKQSYFKH